MIRSKKSKFKYCNGQNDSRAENECISYRDSCCGGNGASNTLVIILFSFGMICSCLLSCSFAQGLLVYMNLPYNWIINFNSPSQSVSFYPFKEMMKINHTSNHILQTNDNTSLGVWHTKPSNINEIKEDDIVYKNAIIYLHGNGESRSFPSNIRKYKLLSEFGHVISFDYRGFGDSSGWPSESGVYNDALSIWKWVTDANALNISSDRVVIYGHSLGAAIATRVVRHLCHTSKECPRGLIIEAPFTSIKELIHSFIPIKSILLFADQMLSHRFPSIENIQYIECNVLILHSIIDRIIPVDHGKKMFQEFLKQNKTSIELSIFKEGGHSYLIDVPNARFKVKEFLQKLYTTPK